MLPWSLSSIRPLLLEYNGKKFSRTLRHLNALAHDQGYKGICLANLGIILLSLSGVTRGTTITVLVRMGQFRPACALSTYSNHVDSVDISTLKPYGCWHPFHFR